MIRSITISMLRGIRQGTLDGLTPLTILTGPNNCGKSTVLDAIMIAASRQPMEAIGFVCNRRADQSEPYRWLLWHSGQEVAGAIQMAVRDSTGSERTVRVRNSSAERREVLGTLPEPAGLREHGSTGDLHVLASRHADSVPDVRFIDPFAAIRRPLLDTLFTRAHEQGLIPQVKGFVSEVSREVKDIVILSPEGKPVVYLSYANGSRPEATAGEGIRMLLRLALELAGLGGGVALVEEPEMHMHPGAIRQAAKAFWAAVGRDIQVIISTHSLELIDALLAETPEGQLEKLSVIRLALKDGELKSARLAGDEVRFARMQIEDDLR